MADNTKAGNTQGGDGNNNQDPGTGSNEDGTKTWEGFMATQPDEIKKLYEANTSGLKSALDAERTANKEAEKALRKLASEAEAGSQAKKDLETKADALKVLQQKNTFYAEAHSAGVTNLNLAWMAGKELVDEYGKVPMATLKEKYPELFGSTKQVINNDAGAGTDSTPPAPETMDDLLRAKLNKK